MKYTGYELLWLFFVYSFAGWILETVFAALKQKNFVNRGLINGPVCIIYGFSAVFISIVLSGLEGIWLFVGIVIDTTVIEWIAGHLIEMLYHERWWDYSNNRWNLDGYISFQTSMLWGVLGFISINWTDDLLIGLFRFIPGILGQPLIWAMLGIFIADNLASYMLLVRRAGRLDRWEAVNSQIANVTARLGKWIAERIEIRLKKAYPQAQKTKVLPREKTVFASGCGFYKVMVLFFVAAFLGDIVETVFCRFSLGWWMSRSSVVWGPFSIVWGIAVAAVTAMLYKYRNRSLLFLFWMGTLLGGAYEYLCSVFTELVFGKIFWDYSKIPFNLGGRVNLLFCFFWGLAAIVWFKLLYPVINRWIEKIPIRLGKVLTWIMIVFMACNIVVSSMALIRYEQRDKGQQAIAYWQGWMDEHYGDERMEKIYPKAKPAPGLKNGSSGNAAGAKSEGEQYAKGK